MNYEELRASVRDGKIAPFYVFEGPEEYLIEFCIEEIKKKLIEPWGEMMNFKSYAFIPPVGEAIDFMETLPVMSERKMLVFRKCGLFAGNIKNKQQWEKAFSSIGEFNCVIIWEDETPKGKKPSPIRTYAEKNGTLVSFPLRSEAQLRNWVEKQVAASGKSIDIKTSSYLIASLERKMRLLKTELGKIIAYSKDSRITREDVDAVIAKPIDESIFNFLDAIFEGRRELCYKQLYTLRALNQEPVSLISFLSGQLLTIYKAKLYMLEGLTRSQAAAKLGGGYGNEKCARKAEKIKVENIEKLISLCFESDKNVKQGKIGAWAALEIIIAEYKFY